MTSTLRTLLARRDIDRRFVLRLRVVNGRDMCNVIDSKSPVTEHALGRLTQVPESFAMFARYMSTEICT